MQRLIGHPARIHGDKPRAKAVQHAPNGYDRLLKPCSTLMDQARCMPIVTSATVQPKQRLTTAACEPGSFGGLFLLRLANPIGGHGPPPLPIGLLPIPEMLLQTFLNRFYRAFLSVSTTKGLPQF